MSGSHQPAACVCIVTRNRHAELATAVESALAQQQISFEVRVYDNASEDGTADMLKARFPEVITLFLETNTGACHARNLALLETSAPYVFFLDDDAYFTDPHTLARAVQYMEAHRTTAAAGLPFVEPVARGMKVWSPPVEYELAGACMVRSVVTCACIVHRKAALEVGGFRESFLQWGEERDFCIRLMAHGYNVEFIRAPQLVHLGSAARDSETMQYLGIRNTLLFDLLNVPWPWFPVRLLSDMARLASHRFFTRGGLRRLKWVGQALRETFKLRRERNPVGLSVYSHYRSLPGHGPIAASAPLPPPVSVNYSSGCPRPEAAGRGRKTQL